MFDLMRRLTGNAVLAAFYAVAPSTVPAWRLEPRLPPALVLPVGEPVRALHGGRAADQS